MAPDGKHAVWWDGTVKLAADGVTWVPGKGRLVLGAWPDGADDAQVLDRGAGTAWDVRWAPDGTVLAVWTGRRRRRRCRAPEPVRDRPGDRAGEPGKPLLENEPAFAGFSLESGRLVYSAPGADGATTV